MEYATTTPKPLLKYLVAFTAASRQKNLKLTWNESRHHGIQTHLSKWSSPTGPNTGSLDGGDPISDAAYTCILVKIFRTSGDLNRAGADWEQKPDGDFKKENNYRLEEQKAMKSVLTANTAITNQRSTSSRTATVDEALTRFGWRYC
jgi:hypothetical protein